MDPQQRKTLFASVGVLISASLWGVYWIPLRHLEDQAASISTGLLLINLPAALLLIVWLIWRKPKIATIKPLLIGAIAGVGITLYGYAIGYTTVVRAAMLFYLMPIWATLIGVFWLGERADWRRWAAVGLGLAGLLLLIILGEDWSLSRGDYIAFLSGIVWAISGSMMKGGGKLALSPLVAGQFLSASLLAVFVGQILGHSPLSGLTRLDASAGLIGVFISVFVLLPAVIMLFSASRLLFPGRVGLLLMAEVVVALVSATILLPEEALIGLEWVAVGLIVSASLVELMPRRRLP